MKKIIVLILCLTICFTNFIGCNTKKEETTNNENILDVYLLFGQSNAVGYTLFQGCDDEYILGYDNIKIYQDGEQSQYNKGNVNKWLKVKAGLGQTSNKCGIEIGFSKVLTSEYENSECRIIRYGWGGKTLYNDFAPPSILKVNDFETRGQYYRNAIETAKRALKTINDEGKTPNVRAILWMQGEHDATVKEYAEAYADNLTALINDLRSEFKNAPFLIGQIALNSPNNSRYVDVVVSAQNQVAENVKDTYLIDTSDLMLDIEKDSWHWQFPEMLELGVRFGEYVKQVIL